jgi:hypothetical protein
MVFVTQTRCVYCKVGTDLLYICYIDWGFSSDLPSLRRLVAGFSPCRPVFDPRPINVRFVVDKITMGQVFLQVLRFSPVSIIPPTLHTNLHPHLALTRQTNVRSLGTFNERCSFGNLHRPVANSSKSWDVQSGEHTKFFTGEGEEADQKVMYILILTLKYNCKITLFVRAFIQYK